MSNESLSGFFTQFAQRDLRHGTFELENDRLLEVNLDGAASALVWTKTGSMVAYRGSVRFEREGVLEHGIGNFLKKAISGEGARLTKATGRGKVYLADKGKRVTILTLRDEAIVVNGNDILAFEPTLRHQITMMRKVAAIVSGGLFSIRLEGTGKLAVTTHFDPLVLEVRPNEPIFTDPNATIAWSGNLQPDIKADMNFKTFIGRGSGESLQMAFSGTGFVVVQPFEELYLQATQS